MLLAIAARRMKTGLRLVMHYHDNYQLIDQAFAVYAGDALTESYILRDRDHHVR